MSRKQRKELKDLLYPACWKAAEDGAAQQNVIVDDEKRIFVTASFAEGSRKGGRNRFVERPCGR